MLEETPCVPSRYSIECPAHRFHQTFAGARFAGARLELPNYLSDAFTLAKASSMRLRSGE
jgi:hypothetical protein